jgi:dipeptidyl aminopeptidase/acylaminoacyl peptidase
MGWQRHTVRGFMAGAMKKAGYTVESFKPEGGDRTYRVSQGELYLQWSRRWLGRMRRPQPQRLTAGSVAYQVPMEDPADPHAIYAVGSDLNGRLMRLNRRTGVFEPYLDGLSADCLDYSPDGQWIAYVSYPGRELWKCRRDGSDKVLLEDSMDTYMPRWSPDGKRLAFAAVRKSAAGEPHQIYTIDPNGGKAEPVKGVNGFGFDPNWSPDGKKLVFAPYGPPARLSNQDRHVFIVDLETGTVEMVPGSEEMFSPRWSPDGKRLVALRLAGNLLVLYDFETKRWADVDSNGREFGFPIWSKDSRYVYGFRSTSNSLIRLDVAARKVEETRTIKEFRLAGNIFPGVSWTPDEEAVVLSDLSTSEVYRIDVDW